MVNLFIILLSVSLQLAAAVLVLRTQRTPGHRLAWALLSAALLLMAGRRLFALEQMLARGLPQALVPNEVFGLVISALMLVGVILIRDLFHAKVAEAAALQEARDRSLLESGKQQALLAAVPIPVWVAEDAACQVIRGNPAAEALLRARPGQNVSHSGPRESRPVHFQFFQGDRALAPHELPTQRAAFNGEEVRDLPLDLVFDDGEVRHLMTSATPIRDLRGQVLGAVCCGVDVTELRHVESALRASEHKVSQNAARLSSLVHLNQTEGAGLKEILDYGLDEAVRLTDSRIGYIYFYDEAKELFTLYSWSKDVMQACTIMEKQTVYELGKTGAWGEVVRQRRPIVMNEFQAPHPLKKGYPEGHAHVARFMSVPLFRGNQIVAVVGVGNKEAPYDAEDVEQLTLFMTGLWNLVERRQAEETLAKAQKLESLGMLAGGLAHDFNNIFQALVANLEMAQASMPPDAKGHLYLQRLHAGLDRASRLSRDILHSSGGDLRRPEALDLSSLVGEAIGRTGLAVQRDLSPDLPKIMADPRLLSRVVEGLLTNAMEATSGQGVIRVRTYLRTLIPVDLNTGHWPEQVEPGVYTVLEVADQGHGIEAAHLGKIFDPFFSTREVGRGLGLAAALGIVRGHKGGIQVESIPGVGSVFRIHLPAPEIQEAPPVAAPAEPRTRSLVLLADDEADLREVMTEMLGDWFSLQVVAVADGQEALDVFSQRPRAFDLVILDATMPRMGGVEAFRAMRTLRPDLPGILCSGYALPISREQAMAQGFADFLKKPFTSAELEALLDRVMGVRLR